MSENTTPLIEVICPECASKIKLYDDRKYGYCSVCTSKINLKDAKNRNLSLDLIKSLPGSEIDGILPDDSNFDLEKAGAASDNGSLRGSVFLASYYLYKDEFEKARLYFKRAVCPEVPDGEYGVTVSDIGEMVNSPAPSDCSYLRELVKKAKSFDQNTFRYLARKYITHMEVVIYDGECEIKRLEEEAGRKQREKELEKLRERSVWYSGLGPSPEPEHSKHYDDCWPEDYIPSGETDLSGTTPSDWGM